MSRAFPAVLLAFLAAPALGAPPARLPPVIAANAIEAARPNGAAAGDPALIVKAETLLDRSGFSPGEIDGLDGDNFRGALNAFQAVKGLPVSGALDPATWTALAGANPAPILKTYTLSAADVAGPFTGAIPGRLETMARLKGLSYTSDRAELAEKFHMSQSLLRALNPHANFARAGTPILAPDVAAMNLKAGRHTVEVVPPANAEGPLAATIVVDKPARSVRVYGADGGFLAFYPATIGSVEKPAPSGAFKVNGVMWNPVYRYDPKFAWKGVAVKRKLTVAPGPNNPVGLVWIDLSAPSYGIHGSPAPEEIGKTESHGCIRLTNWDAVELAAMTRPGTVVRFDDQETPVVPPPTVGAGASSDNGRSP